MVELRLLRREVEILAAHARQHAAELTAGVGLVLQRRLRRHAGRVGAEVAELPRRGPGHDPGVRAAGHPGGGELLRGGLLRLATDGELAGALLRAARDARQLVGQRLHLAARLALHAAVDARRRPELLRLRLGRRPPLRAHHLLLRVAAEHVAALEAGVLLGHRGVARAVVAEQRAGDGVAAQRIEGGSGHGSVPFVSVGVDDRVVGIRAA